MGDASVFEECGHSARAGGRPPMKRKHTYKAAAIGSVRMSELVPLLASGCIVAIDVAKEKFMVALAQLNGEVVKLFRFEHPTQTRLFLALVGALQKELGPARVKVAMEPTGTYGDAVRYQLKRAGVPVEMVQPKRTYDSREIFDGVPSLHDGKSAVLIAKLCALSTSQSWSEQAENRVRLRALVDERNHEYGQEEKCLGKLEALLARHWPEFGRWLDLKQASGLTLLESYGSPEAVTADQEGARALLRRASRGRLEPEVLEGTLREAAETLGVPMTEEEVHYVKTLAQQAHVARRAQDKLEDQMGQKAGGDPVYARLQPWMGTYTAAVIVALCDPTQYRHAGELEKACGLNLRVKSSGEHQGQVGLTKRGPALVRQVLYLFTLRMKDASPEVKAWYEKRAHPKAGLIPAVATMRKLVKAMFHVAKGDPFDASKLFDLKRLEALKAAPKKKEPRRLQTRKSPRSIVRGEKPAPEVAVRHPASASDATDGGPAPAPEQDKRTDLPWTKYQGGDPQATA